MCTIHAHPNICRMGSSKIVHMNRKKSAAKRSRIWRWWDAVAHPPTENWWIFRNKTQTGREKKNLHRMMTKYQKIERLVNSIQPVMHTAYAHTQPGIQIEGRNITILLYGTLWEFIFSFVVVVLYRASFWLTIFSCECTKMGSFECQWIIRDDDDNNDDVDLLLRVRKYI